MNRNSKADCLVTNIAWDFDDQLPLSIFTSGSMISPSNLTQLPDLPDYLSKCRIELNHTKNGLILPLYIPSLALNLVLRECTHSQMAKYLSKPEFTSIGIACYEQWAVFAFATDSPLGNFNSAVNLSDLGLRHFYLVSSLFFWVVSSLWVRAIFHLIADEEDNLLQGLNSYRQAQNLPPLTKNAKADCIANEIADDAEDQPCTVTTAKSNVVASRPSQITKFPDYAEKCKVDIATTADAVVMPVCVPKLVQTLLLTNYTHSQYVKYLNDSRFVGAGLGKEDDWMVVVLTTGANTGSFEGSGAGLVVVSIWGWVVLVVLGFLIGDFVRL